MKRLLMVVVVASALMFLASTVLAQGADAPKPVKEGAQVKPAAKPRLMGEQAVMARVLKLNDEQTAKVADICAEREKAMKAWHEANGEKVKAAEADLKKATEAKDEAAAKTAREQAAALRKDMRSVGEKANEQIMGVLTDEQKAAWADHKATAPYVARYNRAKLTDDQVAKVQAAVKANAEGLKSEDRKVKTEAEKKLVDEIEQNILTAEQREAMKPKAPEPKADAPKADAPKANAPKADAPKADAPKADAPE